MRSRGVDGDVLASAPRTVIGSGQAARAAEEARAAMPGPARGLRVLLVVGPGFRSRPWSDRITDGFRHMDTRIAVQGAMPTPESVARLAGEAQAHHADVVVAVGGGSVLDGAKAAAVVSSATAVTPALVREYCAAAPPDLGLPVITVPTTPGTGVEATPFATIWDCDQGRKLSLRGAAVRPVAAILDPELLVSLPTAQLMSSVLGTMAQGLEAAWSIRSDSRSEALGEAAWAELSWLFDDPSRPPDTIDHRAVLLAGHYSGRAIAIAGTTICHAFSYPLTLRYGLLHGHACAVTLASALQYNAAVGDLDCADPRGRAECTASSPVWPRRRGRTEPTGSRGNWRLPPPHRSCHRPPSFTGIDDTPGLKCPKWWRGAPDQPECDLSRTAIWLRRVHLFRARYFMGRWPGICRR